MFAMLTAVVLAAAPLPAHQLKFEGNRFDVVWVDLGQNELRVLPDTTFADAQKALDGKAAALTNAGIFESPDKPTGLLVSGGKELSPLNTASGEGNFFLAPNGVFLVDDTGAKVVATSEYPGKAKEATQSGPLLVHKGKLHPKLAPGSANKLVRSAVGVANPHRFALVVSEDAVSFEQLARFFRDALRCPDALYLDGVISKLYAPDLGKKDLATQEFGAVIAVVPKK